MVGLMKRQTIHFFTEKEEEFANLLIEIGMKKNTAKVLVFLANITEATSRVIERGTDLRQPEVSIAIRYLDEQNWISSRVSKEESRGRRVRIYKLARPIREIVVFIENKNKNEVSKKLDVMKKLRAHSF
jgi:predicted transcriptional regulator